MQKRLPIRFEYSRYSPFNFKGTSNTIIYRLKLDLETDVVFSISISLETTMMTPTSIVSILCRPLLNVEIILINGNE